jgi:hypothetical protein
VYSVEEEEPWCGENVEEEAWCGESVEEELWCGENVEEGPWLGPLHRPAALAGEAGRTRVQPFRGGSGVCTVSCLCFSLIVSGPGEKDSQYVLCSSIVLIDPFFSSLIF